MFTRKKRRGIQKTITSCDSTDMFTGLTAFEQWRGYVGGGGDQGDLLPPSPSLSLGDHIFFLFFPERNLRLLL